MSNALERTGHRMDEALAKLHREGKGGAAAASPRSFSAPASAAGAPSAVFERCVCAVFDLEWFVRFERQASGIYRVVESIRVHDGAGSGPGAALSRVLSVDEVEGRYPPCPWCGDRAGALYHCDCGAVVCGGRVKGNLFICRDSCGDQWEMGPPAREIKVSEARRDTRDFRGPARGSAAWQAPGRSVNPARLLLSSGTAAVPARPKRGRGVYIRDGSSGHRKRRCSILNWKASKR